MSGPFCYIKPARNDKESYISYLSSKSNISPQQAEAVFYFQINGCLAINRLMFRDPNADWRGMQEAVDGFIRAGLEGFLR